MKLCRKCNILKDESLFTVRNRNKDGLDSYCKECNKAYRIQYVSNKIYKNKRNIKEKLRRKKNPIKHLLAQAKKRAKDSNIEFNLLEKDIIIPKMCPILNIPLFISDNKASDNSISIDRINNDIGYIIDNILILSWRANRIKSTASLSDMKKIINSFNEKKIIFSLNEELNNDSYIKELLRCVKKRAIYKNIYFNLSAKDIVIPYFCPILNIPIYKGNGKHIDNSPSIDRIDNNLGYVKNNIRIISYKANKLKNNASFEEYNKIYNYYKSLLDNTEFTSTNITPVCAGGIID